MGWGGCGSAEERARLRCGGGLRLFSPHPGLCASADPAGGPGISDHSSSYYSYLLFLNRETDRDRQTGRAAVHTVRVSERPPGDSPQQCYVNAEGWRWCDYSLARLTAAGFGWNYSATTRKRRLNAWWPCLTLCDPPLRGPPPTYSPRLFTFFLVAWPRRPTLHRNLSGRGLQPKGRSFAPRQSAETPPQITT